MSAWKARRERDDDKGCGEKEVGDGKEGFDHQLNVRRGAGRNASFGPARRKTGDLRWDEFGNNENMEAINAYRFGLSRPLAVRGVSRVE